MSQATPNRYPILQAEIISSIALHSLSFIAASILIELSSEEANTNYIRMGFSTIGIACAAIQLASLKKHAPNTNVEIKDVNHWYPITDLGILGFFWILQIRQLESGMVLALALILTLARFLAYQFIKSETAGACPNPAPVMMV